MKSHQQSNWMRPPWARANMLAHHRLSQPIYTISSTRIQRARDAPCRPSSTPFRPSSAPLPLLSRLSTLCCRCCCCFFCVSCTRRRLTASGGVTGIPVSPLFRGRSWSCMTTISPCQVGGATLCPPRWMQARQRLLAPLPCHPADWLFQKILTKAERHPHHRGPATPIPHLHPLLPLLLLPLLSRLPPACCRCCCCCCCCCWRSRCVSMRPRGWQ